jgi:hypothetical protein
MNGMNIEYLKRKKEVEKKGGKYNTVGIPTLDAFE